MRNAARIARQKTKLVATMKNIILKRTWLRGGEKSNLKTPLCSRDISNKEKLCFESIVLYVFCMVPKYSKYSSIIFSDIMTSDSSLLCVEVVLGDSFTGLVGSD